MKTKRADSECDLEVKDRRFEIKALSEEGEFEGYGSVFGNKDSYDDVVVKGAFAASLRQHAAENTWPALLFGHDVREPIGEWLDLREDSRGLYAKGRLWVDGDAPDAAAIKAHRMLKSRGQAGLSIGFRTKRWTWDEESETRYIEEVDLLEISIVAFPANTAARVTSVKSAGDIEIKRHMEDFLRDEFRLSRKDAKTVVSRGFAGLLREAGFSKADAEAACLGGFDAFKAARDATGKGSGEQSAHDERDAHDVDLSKVLAALQRVTC